MGGVSFIGMAVVLLVMVSGLVVVGRLLLGGRSRSSESSTPVAHGMTLNCPSCGSETAADRSNCQHCRAEL